MESRRDRSLESSSQDTSHLAEDGMIVPTAPPGDKMPTAKLAELRPALPATLRDDLEAILNGIEAGITPGKLEQFFQARLHSCSYLIDNTRLLARTIARMAQSDRMPSVLAVESIDAFVDQAIEEWMIN